MRISRGLWIVCRVRCRQFGCRTLVAALLMLELVLVLALALGLALALMLAITTTLARLRQLR